MSNDTESRDRHGAHEVAAWLRRHPRFLQHFPDLALSLVVPRELNRRLHELFANAQENERLAVRTHQLTLAMMRERDAPGTVRAMAASLAEDFSGDLVRMVLFQPVVGLEDVDWFHVVDAGDPSLTPFRDALAEGEPICGRLHPDKHALLYGERAAEVQSSALLPVPGVGLVAVGSRDPNRFFPGMGTLFLRMMGESLATALRRFDG